MARPFSLNVYPKVRGLSLVELMVAMLIGLVLIGGVIHVFLGTHQAHRAQEALSRVQESGRFALEILSRDARQAGYRGCSYGVVNNLLNEDGDGYSEDLFDFNSAYMAYAESDVSDVPRDISSIYHRGDILVIKNAGHMLDLQASGNTPVNANNINIVGSSGVSKGTILLVTDCAGGADVFQNRSEANEFNVARDSSSSNPGPGNKNPVSYDFSKQYDVDIQILRASSHIYYVGESEHDASLSSLRRVDSTSNNEQGDVIVDGVYNMRVEFGISEDPDSPRVDRFVHVADVSDWDEIAAIRMHLLVYNGEQNNVVPSVQSDLVFAGANFTPPDRRMYQTFTTTISARNRLK